MKTFHDAHGREWTVEVNVATLKRVKDLTGLDLTKLVDPDSDVIRRLSDDVFLLFECLCALLKPQLESRGLTADEFGQSLDEESTEKAATALFEGTIDFFREQKRMLLKRAFSKVKTAVETTESRAIERAMQQIETEAFDRAIHEALGAESSKTSGGSATASPASSASTPDRSP